MSPRSFSDLAITLVVYLVLVAALAIVGAGVGLEGWIQ